MDTIREQRAQIFRDAKSVSWDVNGLKAVGKKYNLSRKRIEEICTLYALNTLKFDLKTYKKYKRYHRAFALFNLNIRDFYSYYKEFANSTEKEEMHRKIEELFLIIKKDFSSPNFDKVKWLHEHDLSDMTLYSLVNTFAFLDSDILQIVYSTFASYYQYAASVKFRKEDIMNEAISMGLKYNEYMQLVRAYAIHILHIKNIQEEILSAAHRSRLSGRYVYALNRIVEIDNEDELFFLFFYYEIDKGLIASYAYTKNMHLTKEQMLQLERAILIKYQRYVARLKEEKDKYKENAINIFRDYYENDDILDNFCAKNGISRRDFLAKLRELEDMNFKKEVRERVRMEPQNINFQNARDYKLLALYLRNGITVDNVQREFDILDFFMLFPHLKPSTVFWRIKELTTSEKTLIRIFFAPLKMASYINKQDVIRGCVSINDRILEARDLSLIIQFLENNNIPLYDYNFHVACRRYVDGTLLITGLQNGLN